MRKIKRLMAHIEKELDDAHTYAEEALEYPAFDSETVELFHKLSADEMNHMNLLHKDVVRMIETYRQRKGELPADMMARYEHLHKRFIAEAERVGVCRGCIKSNTVDSRQLIPQEEHALPNYGKACFLVWTKTIPKTVYRVRICVQW